MRARFARRFFRFVVIIVLILVTYNLLYLDPDRRQEIRSESDEKIKEQIVKD